MPLEKEGNSHGARLCGLLKDGAAPSTLAAVPVPVKTGAAEGKGPPAGSARMLLSRFAAASSKPPATTATPTGLLMEGDAPTTPVPAAVATLNPALGGSSASPPKEQAAGQGHGVGGAAPPVQKYPFGQGIPAALVEPAPQPHPGDAVQGPEQAAVVRPVLLPYEPAGQGSVAPPAHHAPTGHVVQLAARITAPVLSTMESVVKLAV